MLRIIISFLSFIIPFASSVDYAFANDRYQRCVSLSNSNPQAALIEADEWLKTESGTSSLHCKALALYGLKRFSESAETLDRIADITKGSNNALWLQVMSQSATAWEKAGNFDKSDLVLKKAINYASLNNVADFDYSEMLIKRAAILEKQGRKLDAIQLLDQAELSGLESGKNAGQIRSNLVKTIAPAAKAAPKAQKKATAKNNVKSVKSNQKKQTTKKKQNPKKPSQQKKPVKKKQQSSR